jgi:hypothetical protein
VPNNICVYIEQHASPVVTNSVVKAFREKQFSKLVIAHREVHPHLFMRIFGNLGNKITHIKLPVECDWIGEAMRTIALRLAEFMTVDETCLVISTNGQASLKLPPRLLFSAVSDYDIVFSCFSKLDNPSFYERCGFFDGAIYRGSVVQTPLFQMFWANLNQDLSAIDQLYAQRYFFDEFQKHFKIQTLFEVDPGASSAKL